MKKPILSLAISTHFDAAHHLPNYDGKCANLHGHTWVVLVRVKGEIQSSGFVCDFTTLKKIVNDAINHLDHTELNNFLTNPTCENLAMYLFWILQEQLKGANITLESVSIQEGIGGGASFHGEMTDE